MDLTEALLLFLVGMFAVTGLAVWAVINRILQARARNRDLGLDMIDLRPIQPTATAKPADKAETKQSKPYSANSSWWNRTG